MQLIKLFFFEIREFHSSKVNYLFLKTEAAWINLSTNHSVECTLKIEYKLRSYTT